MIVSRCCKTEVITRHTEEGDYYHCVMCHRACDTFSVLVLNDVQYGMKEPEDTKH